MGTQQRRVYLFIRISKIGLLYYCFRSALLIWVSMGKIGKLEVDNHVGEGG